jgi:hypothetical protein
MQSVGRICIKRSLQGEKSSFPEKAIDSASYHPTNSLEPRLSQLPLPAAQILGI